MSPREFTEEEQERLYSVKKFVLNSLNKQFTVRQLCRQAALNEQRFREGFSRLAGMQVGAYILATRMQTARFLLTHTDKTIKEIGVVCGYKAYKSFLKAYKKFFGVSAGAERRQ